MVVAHRALKIGEIHLLPRQALEDIEQLRGGVVERVVKRHLVHLRALFVPERLLAQVGNPPVDRQIHALEIVEPARQFKNPLRQRRADGKRLRAGFFVKAANVVSPRAAVAHFDLGEFRITRFENFAECNGC